MPFAFSAGGSERFFAVTQASLSNQPALGCLSGADCAIRALRL